MCRNTNTLCPADVNLTRVPSTLRESAATRTTTQKKGKKKPDQALTCRRWVTKGWPIADPPQYDGPNLRKRRRKGNVSYTRIDRERDNSAMPVNKRRETRNHVQRELQETNSMCHSNKQML